MIRTNITPAAVEFSNSLGYCIGDTLRTICDEATYLVDLRFIIAYTSTSEVTRKDAIHIRIGYNKTMEYDLRLERFAAERISVGLDDYFLRYFKKMLEKPKKEKAA